MYIGVNDSTKFQSSMDQPWVIEFQYCQSRMVGLSPIDQPWVIGGTEIQFWNVMLHKYFIVDFFLSFEFCQINHF